MVWVGRDDNRSLGNVTGGTAAAMIWREVMSRVIDAQPNRQPVLNTPILAPVKLNDDPLGELLREQG